MRKKKDVEATFTPAQDITAYELAVIVSKVGIRNTLFTPQQWEELEPSIKRHFQQGNKK